MTSMELLETLGDIGDAYIAEAHQVPKKRLSRRLPLLIAAALAALLAGCAVVYALRAANLKVGTRDYSEPVYDASMALQGYATGTREVLTLSGLKGTAGYQAAREWYQFLASYDPDYEIFYAVRSDGGIPEFADKYAAFSPYTQEMADKIDEIAEKYALSLPGASLSTASEKAALRAMGVDSLLVSGSIAEEKLLSGSFFENGNFRLVFQLQLPEQESWPYQTLCTLAYTRCDSFSPWVAELDEGISWREWDYTAADGTEVLLLRSDDSSTAWLFRGTAEGFLAATVEVEQDLYDDVTGVSQRTMTDAELEQLAGQIDWSMTPTPVAAGTDLTDAGVDTAAQVQTVNGYTLELTSAATDGTVACITLRLTAPEGATLQGSEQNAFLRFGTLSFSGGSGARPNYTYSSQIDAAGNSAAIAVTADVAEQGFAEGEPWVLYLEDLEATCFDSEVGEKTLWASEGIWQFALDFGGSDTRQIELLTEPITVSAAVGMALDGADVYKDCTLTSFVLRSYGATLRFGGQGGEIAPAGGAQYPYVVLKDGTQIPLENTSGGSGTGSYILSLADKSTTIPLDEAEKVLLPDGQVLEVPD